MTKISDIMTPHCEWAQPNATVQEIAQRMKELDCGFIPVGDGEDRKLIGTITDRDIALRCCARGLNPKECTARDVMTDKTYYCYDDQDTEDVCHNMSEIKVRRLPVLNRDKELVGVVSIGDLAQGSETSETGETLKEITFHTKKAA
jgi:CBS domain-containing protein